MSRIIQPPIFVLKTASANGIGATSDVRDYEDIILTVYTSGSFTGTIKFAVSNELTAPNFSIAPSVTNVYDYVQISPINSQLTADKISGSTGIVISGTDIIKMYEVNSINTACAVRWLCPIISGYSGTGVATVELTASARTTH